MANNNTSVTGGYLVETSTPPLNDQSILDFMHGVIEGVTCLPPEFVRPGWQQNPQPIPSIDTDWVSFSISDIRPDNEPHKQINSDGDALEMARNETIDFLCSFYGPNTMTFSSALRDGMYITQNSEQLRLVGMGLVGFSNTLHVPELVNDRYYDRTDMTMTIRREIRRTYPILSFVAAYGQIQANSSDRTITEDFTI